MLLRQNVILFPTMCASKRIWISCCVQYREKDRWYKYVVSQLADSNPFRGTHCIKRTRLKCCQRNIFLYTYIIIKNGRKGDELIKPGGERRGGGHHNSRNNIFLLFSFFLFVSFFISVVSDSALSFMILGDAPPQKKMLRGGTPNSPPEYAPE